MCRKHALRSGVGLHTLRVSTSHYVVRHNAWPTKTVMSQPGELGLGRGEPRQDQYQGDWITREKRDQLSKFTSSTYTGQRHKYH